MPRTARKKCESRIYHVMLRGINRQQIFEDGEDCRKFLSVLKDCKTVSGFKLYAYCIMGNHVHLLIKEEQEGLEKVFRRIGSRFVYWYNAKYAREGHLFQDRYKAEAIDSEEYLFTALRYIHQNPVKAGLCKTVEDYEYSSYREYVAERDIIDVDDILKLVSLESFVEINRKPVFGICLEMDDRPLIPRISDEQARTMIQKTSGCENVSDFQSLEIRMRNAHIKSLKAKGLSIRQLCRLTGIIYSTIQRM